MKKGQLRKISVLGATDGMMEMAGKDVPKKKKGTYYYGTYAISYEYGMYARAVIEEGILKVAFFLVEDMRAGGRKAAYELYVDKESGKFVTYDVRHVKWINAKLDRIEWPGYVYFSGKHINKESAANIKTYLGVPDGSYQDILDYQLDIRKKQLAERDKKETEAWDRKLVQTPELPKDWERWVDKTGISENYIFYQYEKGGAKEGYCTWCEKEVPIRTPKYGMEGKCRCCGRKIQFKSIGKFGQFSTKPELLYLIQRCRDGFVIRMFEAWRHYHKGQYESPMRSSREIRRVVCDKDLNNTAFYYGLYKQRVARWIKTRSWNGDSYYLPQYKGRVYGKSLPALGKNELARTGITQMIKSTGRIDPEIYLAKLKCSPYIEQLVKAGLIRLVEDLFSQNEKLKMKDSKELGKALAIDKQRLKRLRKQNGGLFFLDWLRFEKEQGKNIPDDVILWFSGEKIIPEDISFISDRMSEVQVKNYLVRQMNAGGGKSKELISTWEDYLAMAKRLKMDVDDEIVFRAKELAKRHDELVSIIEENEVEIRAGELAEKYHYIDHTYAAIKEKYAYQNDTYAVLVPNGIEDILNEGKALHHCIDKSECYFDRINKQESFILFLRKKEAIDQPFYTLEVEPAGTIRQKRTEYDRQKEDIKEAEPFLTEWQKEVGKRVMAEDYSLARISKILRIKEFEEMRKDKVVIHGGAYAGRLLADVLQEDLMENSLEESIKQSEGSRETESMAA